MGAGEEGAEDMHEEVGCGDVFQATFAALGKGGAERGGDYYVVWGFAEEGFGAAGDVGFGSGEVGLNLCEAL